MPDFRVVGGKDASKTAEQEGKEPENVETIYDHNATMVAACMKDIAGRVEAAEYGDPDELVGVCLLFDPATEQSVMFAWGKGMDRLRALGLFAMGAADLAG